jgi:hypothetical protein
MPVARQAARLLLARDMDGKPQNQAFCPYIAVKVKPLQDTPQCSM